MSPPPHLLFPLLLLTSLLPHRSEPTCSHTPCTALASYYVTKDDSNLTYISSLFGIDSLADMKSEYPLYNPNFTTIDSILTDAPINVPFTCLCESAGGFSARDFTHKISGGDTYDSIANSIYKNLTTKSWLVQRNSYPENNIPDGGLVNVTVNCSCGDAAVSGDYGLFVTYPLRPGDTVRSVADSFGFARADLLQRYNEGVDFSGGSGIVFVPYKDTNGSYHPLPARKQGVSGGSIAAISVSAGVVLLIFIGLLIMYRRKKIKKISLLESDSHQEVVSSTLGERDTPLHGVIVDKSIEFPYQELAAATLDFSMENKIGQGGFGAVYYAELRGEKTAVKKMGLQSRKEFYAEISILTRVHHLNLVRLIGYCMEDREDSLFLIYEYMENGNLSQHLRSSVCEPLLWASRLQIALDSARGLEYIHEHTASVYVHRDIKSANILLDKNFHAKVADFGLTRLKAGGSSKDASQTKNAAGTFGYMPPEYAQYGDISPKVDVYAFGVVLYELISAKEAIVKTNEAGGESRGLISMFESVFNYPNPKEELQKLIDPRLGDDYPMDAVFKMAEIGRSCTQEDPHLRPNMRTVVVKLMMLSSATGDWDVGHFYDGSLSNLMSGR